MRPSRATVAVRLIGVLSLAKLAGTDQRYYLDQAGGRVDHAGSVSSGAEDYYLGGPEAAGRWTGSTTGLLGLSGQVVDPEAAGRAVAARPTHRPQARRSGSRSEGAWR